MSPLPKNEVYGDFGLPRSQGVSARDWLLAALVASIVLVTGAQLTTQWLAGKLAYQEALGAAWAEGDETRYYAPWQGFFWVDDLPTDEAGAALAKRARNWFALVELAALIAGAVVIMRRLGVARNRAGEIHGSARWAKREDIERAGLLARTGVVVAKWEDARARLVRYLRHDGPEHILVIAPTRSGKGVTVVLSTLLSWLESVLVYDPKGENYAKTSGWRAQLGHRVYKLDFAAPPGTAAAFNPLSAIRAGTRHETADAQRLAKLIMDPDGKQFDGPNRHWAVTGSSLLTGAILHVLYREKALGKLPTLAQVLDELTDRNRSHQQVLLDWLSFPHDAKLIQGWSDGGAPSPTHPVVAAAAREQLNREDRERSSVLSSALAPLTLFRDEVLAANTAHSDFLIEDLMDAERPVALYLVVPSDDEDRLRPLIRIVLELFVRRLVPQMEFADGEMKNPHRHRLLLMVDEFPTLGKLNILSGGLAYIAGWGIKAVLIAQDRDQIREAYGDRETISANCHIIVAFAPNKPETARFLSELAGTATVIRQARSGGLLGPGAKRPPDPQNEVKRPLLTPDEVMHLPGATKKKSRIVAAGDMLVFAAGAPPIRAKQPLFFQDATLLERSRLPPPLHAQPQMLPVGTATEGVAIHALVTESQDDGLTPTSELDSPNPATEPAAKPAGEQGDERPDQHLLEMAAQLSAGEDPDAFGEEGEFFDSTSETSP